MASSSTDMASANVRLCIERLEVGQIVPSALSHTMNQNFVSGYPETQIKVITIRVLMALLRLKKSKPDFEVKVEPELVGFRGGYHRLFLYDGTSEIPNSLWKTTPTTLWGLGLLIVKLLFRREAFNSFDPANNFLFCQKLLQVITFKLQGGDAVDEEGDGAVDEEGGGAVDEEGGDAAAEEEEGHHHLFDEDANYYLKETFINALISRRKRNRRMGQTLFFTLAKRLRPSKVRVSTELLEALRACFATDADGGQDGSGAGYNLADVEAVAGMPFFN